MKIHNEFEQNSLEWLNARAGVSTCSEWDALLTPKFKIRTGEGVKTYIARKVAEAWSGPLPGFNSIDMDFGKFREEEAIPAFEFETGLKVQRVAFITDDLQRIGCSPDGLIGDDCGIEVKCPQAETHVRYVLAGVVPDDYLAQVHGAMYVTGRNRWVFYSYRRHFPALQIVVERDEEIQEQIGLALEYFIKAMDDAMDQLTKLNGGPPRKRVASFSPPPKPDPELMMPN